MAMLLMYPAIAVLALFVVLVIMLILRYGSRWCQLRHTTYADQPYWNEDDSYEHGISHA